MLFIPSTLLLSPFLKNCFYLFISFSDELFISLLCFFFALIPPFLLSGTTTICSCWLLFITPSVGLCLSPSVCISLSWPNSRVWVWWLKWLSTMMTINSSLFRWHYVHTHRWWSIIVSGLRLQHSWSWTHDKIQRQDGRSYYTKGCLHKKDISIWKNTWKTETVRIWQVYRYNGSSVAIKTLCFEQDANVN